MAAAGYYIQFIATPLNNLVKKAAKWKWSPTEQEYVDKQKDAETKRNNFGAPRLWKDI